MEFANHGPWETQLIFMGQAGSAAYGTKTPESDTDLRGVFLAEEDQLIGLSNVETYTEERPIDLQCYELRHFAKLCLNGSPLQAEMLFYPSEVIDISTPAWARLIDIRHAFLSKHLKKTLGGFSQGDIKRIQGNSMAKCGAKGKLLVEKFGYNTKHASNAFRLLRMSELLWTTGNLIVRLPEKDRDEIRAIKQGKYSREEFLKYIADEDKRVFDLADKANLPDEPDRKLVASTVRVIYKEHLRDQWHD